MTGTTHLAAGLFAGATLVLCLHLQPVQGAVVIAGTALGSLVPDIDHKNSTISQKVKPVGAVVSVIAGHRKLLHDPVFYMTAYAALALCYGSIPFTAMPLFLGVSSHLLLDVLNMAGIPFLYMLNKKWRIRLLRVRTGSVTDKAIGKLLHTLAILAAGAWVLRILGALPAMASKICPVTLSLGG